MKRFLLLLVTPSLLLFSCADKQQPTPIMEVEDAEYILYGSPDTSTAHQAVVYIAQDQGGGYMSACTGTAISNDVILTAAHCIGAISDMTVYFGSSVNTFYDMRSVSDTIVHSGYTGTSGDIRNDIAMIRLSSPIPASITPIPPLPYSLRMTSSDEYATPLQYVGFGLTETGSSGTKLTITRPPVKVCTGTAYNCQWDLSGVGYVQIPPKSLAIAMDSAQGGICSGDSGGPAFVTRGNTEYVAGVSSFVLQDSNQNCAYLGASTIVSEFETFINDYLGTSAEICTNGIDDDGDGQTDCNDNDCAAHTACQEHACDNATEIYCGDTLTATTTGADAYYADYSSCSPGAAESGGERAFRINAPAGTEAVLTLTPLYASSNLDLFLTEGGCGPDRCTDYSIFPTGQVEQISFTKSSSEAFAIVETYQTEGNFTISLTCDSENPVENCTNGTDDDGDGHVDCADTDCYNHTACASTEDEVCDNQRDDDGDNLADCFDADCMHTATCVNAVEICNNGIDDDGDLKADCDDKDCEGLNGCAQKGEYCFNNKDDDGDGKADCNDPDCISASHCFPLSEICDNGIDDDGDMRIDCADADCHTFSGCPVPTGEVCYNYIDDDGDGKIDCEDDDCLTSVRCAMARNYENGAGGDDPSCNCRAAGARGSSLPLTFLLLFGFAFILRRARL